MVARRKLKKKIRKLEATIATAIATALGFVMALAWNDAIKDTVDELLIRFGVTGTGYIYSIYAAIVVTIIAVMGIWIVARWQK